MRARRLPTAGHARHCVAMTTARDLSHDLGYIRPHLLGRDGLVGGADDELTEILTLAQTRKLERRIAIVLYGTKFWREVINFDALVQHGMIAPEDLQLFRFADDPTEALSLLQAALAGVPAPGAPEAAAPAFSRSACHIER